MKKNLKNSNQIDDVMSVTDDSIKPRWSFTGMTLKTKNDLVAEEVLDRLKYFKRTFKIWKDYEK